MTHIYCAPFARFQLHYRLSPNGTKLSRFEWKTALRSRNLKARSADTLIAWLTNEVRRPWFRRSILQAAESYMAMIPTHMKNLSQSIPINLWGRYPLFIDFRQDSIQTRRATSCASFRSGPKYKVHRSLRSLLNSNPGFRFAPPRATFCRPCRDFFHVIRTEVTTKTMAYLSAIGLSHLLLNRQFLTTDGAYF